MRNKSSLLMVIVIVLALVLIYFLFADRRDGSKPVDVNKQVSTENSGSKKSELFVYTWADYIKPELVQRFEKENNCRVTIDTFDSNEAMYSKLKAGATGYDIITPSSYMVTLLKKQDMIIDLDHSKIPNLPNVDSDYLKLSFDPAMKYSVPYMFSVTGIGYLKSKAKDFKPTWGVFGRKDMKGRMTMLNDMRETIGAALKFLGKSINSTDVKDLEAAKNVVVGWKRNLAKFENEQYKTGLASGEFYIVHGYGGDLMQVQSENSDIEFAIPQEGTSVCFDDLVIPKMAKNVELAYKFINFLHDPKVAAENTEFIRYLCPNKASYEFISPETRNNQAIFLKPEIRAKCEIIDDLGDDNQKYTKIWDQIKAAQ
jgi:spermidine/putrescine transport system substrate-binding protein